MLWLIRSDQCHHSVSAAVLEQAMPSGRVVPSGRGGAVRSEPEPGSRIALSGPPRPVLATCYKKRQRRPEVWDVRRSRGHVVGGRTKCAGRHEGPWRPPPPGWVGEQAHICSLCCVLCMNARTLSRCAHTCMRVLMHCESLNQALTQCDIWARASPAGSFL